MPYRFEQKYVGLRWVVERREADFDDKRHHYIERYWPAIKLGRAVVMMNSYSVVTLKAGSEPTSFFASTMGNEIVGRVAALPTTSERWLSLLSKEIGALQMVRLIAKHQKDAQRNSKA